MTFPNVSENFFIEKNGYSEVLEKNFAREKLDQKCLRNSRIGLILIEAFDKLITEFTKNKESIVSKDGITSEELQAYERLTACAHNWQELALKRSQLRERLINQLSESHCTEENAFAHKLPDQLRVICEKHTEWKEAQTIQFRQELVKKAAKITHLASNRVVLKVVLVDRYLYAEKNIEGTYVPLIEVCLFGKKIQKVAARCHWPCSPHPFGGSRIITKLPIYWFLEAKEGTEIISNQSSLQLRLICSQTEYHSERIPFENMLRKIIVETGIGIQNLVKEQYRKLEPPQREQIQVLQEFSKNYLPSWPLQVEQRSFLPIQKFHSCMETTSNGFQLQ